MGSWGPGPFENDAAVDWLDEATNSSPGLIHKRILATFEKRQDDADDDARAIAAAAVVAASAGGPSSEYTNPDAGVLGDRIRLHLTPGLVQTALATLRSVLVDGELARLWLEAGEADAWSQATRSIVRDLELHLATQRREIT